MTIITAMMRYRLFTALCALLGLLVALPAMAAEVEWSCPPGFVVKEGLNKGFPIDGMMRAFVVVPPRNATGPRPVWVPLTGSVEATNWNLTALRSGNNAHLADAGFMVVGPVRECAEQDPALAAGQCNGPGHDGWNWNPWHEGRADGPAGDRWKTDAGSDARFLHAMVRCVGTKWPLDAKRLYLGGISSGATMTNRALLFGSDFWAGGLTISGEWYVTRDDGTALSFADARAAVAADPTHVFQGRVGPMPLPAKVGPMVVMTVWGGDKDLWNCAGVLCADYRPSTQAGTNYWSRQPAVVSVACSATHGHMWPQVNTDAFNLWALTTLASFPKGSDPKTFRMNPPPPGYQCRVGAFTDHY